MKERENYISYLRVFSMLLIVICHLAIQSSNQIAQMSVHFLNVGVEIFFLISGFLFGRKTIEQGYLKWYKRRALRLLPQYYIFLAVLALIHAILHIHEGVLHWGVQLLCLQGLEIYVNGAEQLWFITVLGICYLITPFLNEIRRKCTRKTQVGLFAVSIFLQIVVTLTISTQAGIYWALIHLYIVAYIMGACNFKCSDCKGFVTAIFFAVIAAGARLVGRHYFDETVYYNVFIVKITQAILAISIFACFQFLFKRKPGKIIRWMDSISYEEYLVHCMFITGPVSLMHLTPSYIGNCMIILAVSFISASALHSITEKMLNIAIIKQR